MGSGREEAVGRAWPGPQRDDSWILHHLGADDSLLIVIQLASDKCIILAYLAGKAKLSTEVVMEEGTSD